MILLDCSPYLAQESRGRAMHSWRIFRLHFRGTCSIKSSGVLSFAVWWFAPFFSGGGYSSEAIDFALALDSSPVIKEDGCWITQHGDAIKRGVLQV